MPQGKKMPAGTHHIFIRLKQISKQLASVEEVGNSLSLRNSPENHTLALLPEFPYVNTTAELRPTHDKTA